MELIQEMKTEAALITGNSPYAEVRAVVDNTDDPTTPSSTIRAWVIGLVFVCILAFVNQMFWIRQPGITIMANVAQLLSYPIGKAAERYLPDIGFTLFGIRHSLNPGRFTKKEHMLITIMANVGWHTPYTDYIIWTQILPQFFNQPYARGFLYQILISLGTNFIGYVPMTDPIVCLLIHFVIVMVLQDFAEDSWSTHHSASGQLLLSPLPSTLRSTPTRMKLSLVLSRGCSQCLA